MKIWSLIPLLRYQFGHPYHYNKTVGDACKVNGWRHSAYVPISCLIEGIPSSWKRTLGEDYFVATDHSIIWKTPYQKLKSIIKTFWPLCRALREIDREAEDKKIVFIEQFFLPQFVTLCLSFLLIRPKVELWILHRNSPHQMAMDGKLYHFIHKMISSVAVVKLLTDSDLLKFSQEPVFNRPIFVMPIPHTEDYEVDPYEKKKDEILMWWPGGSTTPAKGLWHIQKLTKSSFNGIKLVVADSAAKHLENSALDIQYVKADLPREEYTRWMKTADIILLPYDAGTYKEATSGIFVESIVAGCIPLTMKGTWMAYELLRFDLGELLVDWNDNDLLNTIYSINNSPLIKEKVEKLRKHYREFHSLNGFARMLVDVSGGP